MKEILITILIVALAAGYIIRKLVREFKGRETGFGCGQCTKQGCPYSGKGECKSSS